MKVICAWCKKVIREGELIDGQVSHGICADCLRLIEKEFEAGKDIVQLLARRRLKKDDE